MRVNLVYIDRQNPISLNSKALPKVVTLQVIYFPSFHTLHGNVFIEALTQFLSRHLVKIKYALSITLVET